ncbi:TrmH family RNA methyltransferase [Lewinella cohaerens]|uniref:TrmH family RNA methyltransferase n=1 Tax=Lewinella cohaerens TaxID=70995 RepID=UPI00036ABF65|nr:RNA methyltransferase [Lewinella cohaerens]
MAPMTEQRRARLREVAYRRQKNFTVILENVHDPHNISAVMRSCEAVGISDLYILYTEKHLQEEYITLGKKSSAGSRKWLDVHYYTQLENCLAAVRANYDFIYATHMAKDAVSLHDLNLTDSVALLFGNEHDGVSEEALSHVDGNFLIPQMGMVQSLNISVACAVSVFEGLRQRLAVGYYGENNPTPAAQQEAIFEDYVQRHEQQVKGKKVKRLD